MSKQEKGTLVAPMKMAKFLVIAIMPGRFFIVVALWG